MQERELLEYINDIVDADREDPYINIDNNNLVLKGASIGWKNAMSKIRQFIKNNKQNG